MTMVLTDEQIMELATQHGFISAPVGYSQPCLWFKFADDGGYICVYPTQERQIWTVTFFGPNSNVPYGGTSFPGADEAFRYAAEF